jgi:hypothetical protein
MTKARVNADNASADIQGVTAGTGLTGGGTSGTVTLDVDTAVIQARVANVTDTEIGYLDGVNSALQTQLDAKIAKTLTTTTGDIIYASAANTPARLGIGTTGQVLKVSSGLPSWGTDNSGYAWTQVASGSLSGSSVSITSLSSDEYYIELSNWSISSDGLGFAIQVNGATSYNYGIHIDANSSTYLTMGGYVSASSTFHTSSALIQLAKTDSTRKPIITLNSGQQSTYVLGGVYMQSNTITSIQLLSGTGNWDAGTYKIWGRG